MAEGEMEAENSNISPTDGRDTVRHGYYRTICEGCGLEVQVTDTSEYFMRMHLQSGRHRRAMEARESRAEQDRATKLRTTLFPVTQSRSVPSRQPYEPSGGASRTAEPTAAACEEPVQSSPNIAVAMPVPRPQTVLTEPEVLSETQPHDSEQKKPCEGVPVDWTAGPVLKTFPWQVMEDRKGRLGFHISDLKKEGRELWLQSDICELCIGPEKAACPPCSDIPFSRAYRTLADRASQPWVPHTPYEWLNQPQFEEALARKSSEIAELRSKEQTRRKKLDRVVHKLDDWKHAAQ